MYVPRLLASLLGLLVLGALVAVVAAGPAWTQLDARPGSDDVGEPEGDAPPGPEGQRAPTEPPRTVERDYVVTGASGQGDGTGASNRQACSPSEGPGPATDAVCVPLRGLQGDHLVVDLQDASGGPVFARTVFVDDRGTRAESYEVCGSDRFPVPPWASQVRIEIQAAPQGLVASLEGLLGQEPAGCQGSWGTTGTVTLTVP